MVVKGEPFVSTVIAHLERQKLGEEETQSEESEKFVCFDFSF